MATANPSANPYQPPRAAVADIDRASGEVQPINLWSARGRIGRLRYLAYLGASYLLMLPVFLVAGLIMALTNSPFVAMAIYAVVGIVYAVWAVMMMIQRSHDMGWTGWTVLLAIIPFVALIWLFKAGTPGRNEYGAPPPPNTRAVKILAWVFPAFIVLGIVAAIALPAYQQYVMRAKAAQIQAQPQQQQQP
jgi:uncharacterized membrane protein YhaH (DUF805 family)